MLTLGSVLQNRYLIQSFLGRGGMADVFLALDQRRQVQVAIKALREDLAEDPEFVERFRREAKALAELDHPYIVRFYAFEQQGNLAYIVMDYIPGTALRSRLMEADGPLPFGEVTVILQQVGSALQYAHNVGYVHRDIKPGNILIRSDGTALLSDFGIARMTEVATMTMGPIGAPAYMSPEQILGKNLTKSSDIYSLGITLYEMVTGRRPFTDASDTSGSQSRMQRIREQHLHEQALDPRRFNPSLSADAAQVIMQALAKNPDDRWPGVMAMVRSWEQAFGASSSVDTVGGAHPTFGNKAEVYPVAPQPPAMPPSPRPAIHQATKPTRTGIPLIAVLAIVVFLIVAVLGLLSIGFGGSSPAAPPPVQDTPTPIPPTKLATETVDTQSTIAVIAKTKVWQTTEASNQTVTASEQKTATSNASKQKTVDAQPTATSIPEATASKRPTAMPTPNWDAYERAVRQVVESYGQVKQNALRNLDSRFYDEVLIDPVLERQKRSVCSYIKNGFFYTYANRDFRIDWVDFEDERHATVFAHIIEDRYRRKWENGEVIDEKIDDQYDAVYKVRRIGADDWYIYCLRALEEGDDPYECEVVISSPNPCTS